MSRTDLQFDDNDITDLMGEQTLFLGDTRHKKDDDLQRVATPPPATSYPHQPHRQQQQQAQAHYTAEQPPPQSYAKRTRPPSPHGNVKLCKTLSVICFIGFTLFFVALIAISIISNFKHSDTKYQSSHGIHHPSVVHTQEIVSPVSLLGSGGTFKELPYEFTTATEIQVYNRYGLTDHFPDLVFSSLTGYRICCTSQSRRFICGSGYTFSNGLALDGYLAEEDETSVYLYLLVNSDDLAGATCELTIWLKSE